MMRNIEEKPRTNTGIHLTAVYLRTLEYAAEERSYLPSNNGRL